MIVKYKWLLTLRKECDEEDDDEDCTETRPGGALDFVLSDSHRFNFRSTRDANIRIINMSVE